MEMPFKRLDERALLPTRHTKNSAGLDLCAIDDLIQSPGAYGAVHTGLSTEIPDGYYGRIAPRSGIAVRDGIDTLAGVIDSDYRGEIICVLVNHGAADFQISRGDRIAQLIIEKIGLPYPFWSDTLLPTEREQSGFGSSGT